MDEGFFFFNLSLHLLTILQLVIDKRSKGLLSFGNSRKTPEIPFSGVVQRYEHNYFCQRQHLSQLQIFFEN